MEEKMKRVTLVLVFLTLLAPALLLAQDRQTRADRNLKQLGLTDSQITRVLDLQAKMENAVRQDMVHLRLIRAQIAEALLPASPDKQKINRLIDTQTQTRAELEKNLISDQLEIRKVVGEQIYQKMRQSRRDQLRGTFFGPKRRDRDQSFGRPPRVPMNPQNP
jgi:septal ring factor EnvC (AmiA/AmiB activator)